MNSYISEYNTNFFCLNKIYKNVNYYYNNNQDFAYLVSGFDGSRNPLHRDDGPAIEWEDGG